MLSRRATRLGHQRNCAEARQTKNAVMIKSARNGQRPNADHPQMATVLPSDTSISGPMTKPRRMGARGQPARRNAMPIAEAMANCTMVIQEGCVTRAAASEAATANGMMARRLRVLKRTSHGVAIRKNGTASRLATITDDPKQISECRVIGEHLDAGPDADQREGTQHDRHARTSGNAEEDGGDHRSAFLGIVGGLGRNDTGERSLAIGGFGGHASRGLGIGEPARDARPDARGYPNADTIERAYQDHPPVMEGGDHAIDYRPKAGLDREREASAFSFAVVLQHLRNNEQAPDNCRHGDAVPQLEKSEGKARRSRERLQTATWPAAFRVLRQ